MKGGLFTLYRLFGRFRSMLSELEQGLFEHFPTDLATASLIASGVEREGLRVYLGKIAYLVQLISRDIPLGLAEVERARAIFDWLWRSKPNRYKSGGNFTLTEVIDAQLGEGEWVGNCLGLTTLYNSLAQRLGIEAVVIHLENAFGRGPHVLSRLHTDKGSVEIENILPQGFDYRGHLSNSEREEWGRHELVADIYFSKGNTLLFGGRPWDAIDDYDKALHLNPGYINVYVNKGIAISQIHGKGLTRALE